MKKLFFSIACFILITATINAQDGFLDNTFGKNGIVTISAGNAEAYSTVIQDDGKILVAGYITGISDKEDFVISRLKTDGTLDQ